MSARALCKWPEERFHVIRAIAHLQQEIPNKKWVLPQDQPSCISNHLKSQAGEHANQEAPRSVPESKTSLRKKQSGEGGEVEHIAGQVGRVVEEGLIAGACFESTKARWKAGRVW